MAFQRDYILRLIEMMGDFFRRIGDMIDQAEQLREMDALCREHCGMPLNTARELTMDTLTGLLTPQARLILSEILYVRGRACSNHDDEAAQDFLRALRLLNTLNEDITLCTERAERLKDLLDRAEDLLTADDYIAAARFFMSADRFPDCEDAVFMAVDCAKDRHTAALEGIALFRNILVLPDDILLAGGMPREDAERAILDLQKRMA